jgi:hypothetical protein
MKNLLVKKVYLFFTSLFIFLLHLPFVFAKTKLSNVKSSNPSSSPQHLVIDTSSLNTVLEKSVNESLYDSLRLSSLGLGKQVFEYAMMGFNKLKKVGSLENDHIISIVDFSKPSSLKRLFVIDLENYKVLFNTYVAHGVNSGKEFARQFSNVMQSNQSSLGFYTTANTYSGKHGYSLHLQGMEKGINDNAFKRDIVVHGAEYVSELMVQSNGYVGRSHGCPAIPEQYKKPIIDKIKNGTCLFIFGEDQSYLNRSNMLNYGITYNLAHG